MDQSIEEILNGPDYFLCDRYKARMKKTVCVEKQAGSQAGFEIDYKNSMCRDCAQGIEIKGEVQGLDIKQIRRERRAFAYKNKKKAQGTRRKVQGKDKYVGAQGTVTVDEHVRPAVITEGKEGEEMAKCLVKDCDKEGKHRGLCSAHIQRFRKGTLPGVEPLPSNRGKSTKKDRLNKIKESAGRVKAQGAKSKAHGEEKDSSKLKAERKTEIRSQESEVSSQKVEVIPVVAETVSSGIVSPVLPFNVDKMEEGNREGIKVLARAFVAGLKSEFIAAMTEQACSIEQSAESKG